MFEMHLNSSIVYTLHHIVVVVVVVDLESCTYYKHITVKTKYVGQNNYHLTANGTMQSAFE